MKSADRPAFLKGPPTGLTALRKALLACPKATAALFLRAFESSFTLHVIAVSLPYPEATGTCPKPYDLRVWERASRTRSIQVRYAIKFGLWAVRKVWAKHVQQPRTWCSRSKQIVLIQGSCEARKIAVMEEISFLTPTL